MVPGNLKRTREKESGLLRGGGQGRRPGGEGLWAGEEGVSFGQGYRGTHLVGLCWALPPTSRTVPSSARLGPYMNSPFLLQVGGPSSIRVHGL